MFFFVSPQYLHTKASQLAGPIKYSNRNLEILKIRDGWREQCRRASGALAAFTADQYRPVKPLFCTTVCSVNWEA